MQMMKIQRWIMKAALLYLDSVFVPTVQEW